jgi:molybdate transport system substrate-binding protein
VTGEVTVFAASSLTDAFNEMGTEFTKANPRATVKFNYAASTALRTQLEQGAKADVYASADQVQMDNAKKSGLIDGEDRLFVKNKLVVIYPAANPGKITAVKDLANPGLKLVLTDKNVPIGAYARTALEKMSADAQFGADFSRKVLNNLKSEEANVRAVVTKVQLGEADAAIVYASDVTPAVSKDITAILIPDQFNTIATYPIAVVKDAPNKAAAQAFIQYVRSAPGQAILKKWNFIVDADTGMARAPRPAPPTGLSEREALAAPAPARTRHTARASHVIDTARTGPRRGYTS